MFIKRIEIRELRMRLLHPFETSFGSTQDRHIILVSVTDGTHTGWGEVTAAEGPFYSSETWETAWHVLCDYVIPNSVWKRIAQCGGVRGIGARIPRPSDGQSRRGNCALGPRGKDS